VAIMMSVVLWETIPGGICADFNYTKTGPFRVQALDLARFRTYFEEDIANVPCCDSDQNCTPDGVLYNFWTN